MINHIISTVIQGLIYFDFFGDLVNYVQRPALATDRSID